MNKASADSANESLEPLVGAWRMEAIFPPDSPAAGMNVEGAAETIFEWLPGRQFLIQRWQVPHPAAPDGIAIIGWDAGRDSYVQHYFDTRGVARLYQMTIGGGVWKLSRTAADFSPLDFAQRFSGRFSDDGTALRGSWEIAHDRTSWEHDFELVYTRIG